MVARLLTAATRSAAASLRSADQRDVDGRHARETRRIAPDRDQRGSAGAALAILVAEVEAQIDVAGKPHVGEHRPEIERIAGRERFRPHPELAATGHRKAEQLGKLDHLALALTQRDFIADRQERVLGLDQQARNGLDVLLVGANPHRHVEQFLVHHRCAPLGAQHVVGNGEEHRAARRSRGELERAPHGLGNSSDGLCLPVPFGQRRQHVFLMLVFLRSVAADLLLRERADDQQQRDAVLDRC